jgi:O-antigen/teichoic acid export membrane protein
VSVRRNVVANHIAQAWAAGISLACLPLTVRFLGLEAYGMIGAFAALQTALALFDGPLIATVNREMARFTAGAHSADGIRSVLRTLELLCVGVGVTVLAVVLVTRGWFATSWFQASAISVATIRNALLAMAVVVAVRLVEGLYRGALYGLERQVQFSVTHALLSTVRSVGAVVVVAKVSPTLEAFFLWQAASSALAVSVLGTMVYRSLPAGSRAARFSGETFRGLRDFTAGVMGITIVSLALSQADKVVLSRLLPLESFGYYTLAVTVATALYRLSEPIMDAVYPRLTALVAAGQASESIALYHDTAQLVSTCTIPAALTLSAFAGGVLYAWTGDAVIAARTAPVLAVYAVGVGLNCLMTVPYRLQLANGWTSLALIGNTIYVALLWPALIWVAPRFGAVGAAAIWTVLNVAFLVVNVPLMHRRVLRGELARYYVQDLLGPGLAAAAAIALATLAAPPMASRLAWLTFLAIAGGAAFRSAVAASPSLRRRVGLVWST